MTFAVSCSVSLTVLSESPGQTASNNVRCGGTTDRTSKALGISCVDSVDMIVNGVRFSFWNLRANRDHHD